MIKILESNFNITEYNRLKKMLVLDVLREIKPHKIDNLTLILKDRNSKCVYCIIDDIILYDENINSYTEEYKFLTYIELVNYYSKSQKPTRLEERKEFLEEFYTYITSNDESLNFIPSYHLLSDLNNLDISNDDKYKYFINKILFKEYLDFNSTCEKVFDYNKYIKPIRAQVIESTNIEVCPYCNEGLIHILDSGSEEMRALADLDHFYLQSKLPLFALTFNNFIPCCITCNRALKLQSTEKILNPRYSGFDNKARFVMRDPLQLTYKEFSGVEIFLEMDKSNIKYLEILGSKEVFKLEEIYNHKSTKMELKRIYNSTKSLAKGKLKNYQDLFGDEEEITFEKVYENLIGFEIDANDFINFRYGKLISDIFSKEFFR